MENIKINVMTLFSGYDSQCMALDRLKANYPFFDYELIYWCEIDENAIKAHNAIYPQWSNRNLGDISKINFKECNNKIDLLTYSFPCTSISLSGKQAGFEKGSGTASSLLWEVERAIKELKPKYLMMENVKALVSNKFRPLFKTWCSTVESYGYTNFINILNAKDFGCPQNRERVFMVSILRTEQEPNPSYYFPKPFKLETRIKDVLEKEVDESFYLSDSALEYFCKVNNMQKAINTDANGNAKAIRACYGQCGYDSVFRGMGQGITGVMEEVEPKIIGYSRDKNGDVVSRHLKEVANTVHTFTGGGWNTDQFVAEPKIAASRGRGEGWKQHLK